MHDLEATSQLETLPTPIPGHNSHTDDEKPARGGREGLPKTYRSRHDPHYVEHLISERAMPLLRVLPIGAIDAADLPDPAQLGALKESIARLGVLQPIVVRAHEGRFTLVAGRRRLAAAREAGLREIPCLVHTVDDAQAAALAEALNPPPPRAATRADVASQAAAAPFDATTAAALTEAQDALVTVRSSLQWLPRSSAGTRERVAARLLRADLERAEWVVAARLYLAGALRVSPASVGAAELLADFSRFSSAIALHGGALEVLPAPGHLQLEVDRGLMAAAVRGLLWTLLAVGELAGDRRLRMSLTGDASTGRAALAVCQPAAVLTQPMILRFFEDGAAGRPGGVTGELAVRLARLAAARHGAGLEVSSATGDGTTVTLTFD